MTILKILDEKVEERWKNYVWQSVVAGISIAVILTFFVSVVDLVIVAAVGATSFTVFAIPYHKTARPRNVIGGQAIGVLVGLVFSYVPLVVLQGALAVTFVTLFMVTLDCEHPPAAGTALGLAVSPSFEGGIFVLSAVVVLSGIRLGLSEHLVDLT